jgi:AraC family transcriptional regulator
MQMSSATAIQRVSISTAASHQEAVKRVILAMRACLDQRFTLHSLASIANSSPFHFNRVFRRVTGIPPLRFLYALRLEFAKQLLLTTDASVIDVCYEVGYNSLGTFTRRFTDLLGVSPTRLRSMAQMPLDRIVREGHPSTEPAPVEALTGQIAVAPGFEGLIVIGLFRTPIPEGKPAACTVVRRAGPYDIQGVPDGRYHLFGLGLPWVTDRNAYFDYSTALRGGGQEVSIKAGKAVGCTDVRLRPPAVTDPPILLAVPWLMRQPEVTPARQAIVTSGPGQVEEPCGGVHIAS